MAVGLVLDEAVWRIANCAPLRQQQQPRTSAAAPLFCKVDYKGRKLSLKSSLYSIDHHHRHYHHHHRRHHHHHPHHLHYHHHYHHHHHLYRHHHHRYLQRCFNEVRSFFFLLFNCDHSVLISVSVCKYTQTHLLNASNSLPWYCENSATGVSHHKYLLCPIYNFIILYFLLFHCLCLSLIAVVGVINVVFVVVFVLLLLLLLLLLLFFLFLFLFLPLEACVRSSVRLLGPIVTKFGR